MGRQQKQRFKGSKAKQKQKLMRVTTDDQTLYDDLRRKVKSKISRVKNKYSRDLDSGDIAKFTRTNPKEMTRKMYNDLIEKAQSFINRSNTNYQFKKNKNGVVITQREFNEIKRNIAIDQRNAKKRAKEDAKKNLKNGNVYLKNKNDEIGQMGNFNFDSIQNRTQFEKRLENSRKRAEPDYFDKRLIKMRENYIEKMYDVFNSDADPIVMMINEMSLKDFYELYKREKRMQFDVVYVQEDMSEVAEDYANEISYYIERYNMGFYKDGLEDFPDTW